MPDRHHLFLIWKCTFLAMLVACLQASNASAQEVINTSVEYVYGERVVFSGSINSEIPVQDVLISFRTRGATDTIVERVMLFTDGNFKYEFPVEERPLRAFTTVDYWFNIIFEDGTEFTSPTFDFVYLDNRFDWQQLSDDPFEVFWFGRDLSFAQSVLDVAREGLNRIQGIVQLEVPSNVRIYVYKNADQIPIEPLRDWVAGHAYPDIGLMIVSIPDSPELRLEIERQVPHELMHVLLYQTIGQGYANLPTWLNEGLATMAQLYPTPEYQVVLENAIQNNSLIPIATLCQGFPSHASSAYLSYAEATYFTRYIYRQYGSSGLAGLIANYANGLDCERGVEVALGVSLSSLEEQWLREALGATTTPRGENRDQLVSWIFLLLVVLAIPLGVAAVAIFNSPRKQPQV